jgi:hypothetical protein
MAALTLPMGSFEWDSGNRLEPIDHQDQIAVPRQAERGREKMDAMGRMVGLLS